MIYPPPPYLIMMAWSFGKINDRECKEMLREWHEKAEREGKTDDEA